MVVADDGRDVPRDIGADRRCWPDLGVAAHHDPLVVPERPGLVQDVLRHGDLADVVEQGPVGHALEVVAPESHVRGEARRAVGEVPAVVPQVDVLGLDGVRQRHHDGVRLLHAPRPGATPKRAAQTRQQLQLLEGLGDEVVRARVERGDHVLGRGVRGDRR